ncbi:type II secretion system F family protein [Paenibacillus turpanensis]|uniref:type II secretion system F family protein n=1 Tax=Paenibacillus turpanensis TaxID=2689078 RepID=UPI003132CFE9
MVIIAAAALCTYGVLVWRDRGKVRDGKREKGFSWRTRMNIPVRTDKLSGTESYDTYVLSQKELFVVGAAGFAAMALIGRLFYEPLLLSVITGLLGLSAVPFYRKAVAARRKQQLTLQFKQALYSVSSSLSAGKSVENAFRSVNEDLSLLYPQGDVPMMKELERIVALIELGEPIEKALEQFAARSGVEEIQTFSDIFRIGKRSGVDLVHVVRLTSQSIGEKIDMEQEISVMLAQKRFESKALLLVPLVLLAFLKYSSPDYVAPLYAAGGIVVMTAALLVLGGAFWFVNRLMNIKV